jgi:hypothetical protein
MIAMFSSATAARTWLRVFTVCSCPGGRDALPGMCENTLDTGAGVTADGVGICEALQSLKELVSRQAPQLRDRLA